MIAEWLVMFGYTLKPFWNHSETILKHSEPNNTRSAHFFRERCRTARHSSAFTRFYTARIRKCTVTGPLETEFGFNINYEAICTRKFAIFKNKITMFKKHDLTLEGEKNVITSYITSSMSYLVDAYTDHIPKFWNRTVPIKHSATLWNHSETTLKPFWNHSEPNNTRKLNGNHSGAFGNSTDFDLGAILNSK